MAIDETVPLASAGAKVRRVRAEVLEGPDAGVVFESLHRISIGSGDGNDLKLTDPTVSRFHAEIVREGSRVLIVDLGSTNGISVAGVWVQRAWLSPGATLTLGRTVVGFSDGDMEEPELFPHQKLVGLVGSSPIFRELLARLRKVAASEASVLITGETGTGKEEVARAIHALSPRHEQPCEVIDCGSVIPTLLASELFGHERGAFTGAEHRHLGAFERADGGTLFLDEIGELPADLQTALLGALERRSFRRLGGKDRVEVDVRVLAATNRDLRAEVNAGTFRADLYYRLAVVQLSVPPLRERSEDIPLLVELFLRAAGHRGPVAEVIDDRGMQQLMQHRWPGNVRELRNVVQAALIMGEPLNVPGSVGHGSESRAESSPPYGGTALELGAVLNEPYTPARAAAVDGFEALYVKRLLLRTRGNVSQAAREAQINRSYLNRLIKRHGIRSVRD